MSARDLSSFSLFHLSDFCRFGSCHPWFCDPYPAARAEDVGVQAAMLRPASQGAGAGEFDVVWMCDDSHRTFWDVEIIHVLLVSPDMKYFPLF